MNQIGKVIRRIGQSIPLCIQVRILTRFVNKLNY